MKKLICILLAVLLVVAAFAGCAKNDSAETTASYEKTSEIPAERIAPQTVTPAESFAGGDGSEAAPYQISNAAELALLEQLFNESGTVDDTFKSYDGKYYVLTDDIVINTAEEMATADTKAPTYGWNPIGKINNDESKGHAFNGILDGQNHTISGIYVITAYDGTDGPEANAGVFAYLNNAVIKNVTLADSYFYSYNQLNGIGALAGNTYQATLQGCQTENTYIYSNAGAAGGLVGTATGTVTITDCVTNGTLEGDNAHEIGGIISSFNDGVIENCENNMTVVNAYGVAGGICGLMQDSADTFNGQDSGSTGLSQIKGCTNNGEITAKAAGAAGIVARATSSNAAGEVLDCTNNGAIDGAQITAGIVGNLRVSKNTIDSTADHQGAFTLSGCVNKGSVKSGAGAGGIVSHIDANDAATVTVKDNTNEGTLSGNTIGGIVAFILNGSGSSATIALENCKNTVEINGSEASTAAGIIGSIGTMGNNVSSQTTVTGCVNDGNVVTSGGFGIGGVIGSIMSSIEGGSPSLVFDSCVNNGTVEASFESATVSFAGGLVGALNDHTKSEQKFVNCVNNGAINVTVTDTKAADIKPEEDICYCYVGGIAGAATESTVFEGCQNNGQFTLVEGNEKDIHFEDICGLTADAETDSFMKEIYKQMSENYEKAETAADEAQAVDEAEAAAQAQD
ncbi:MAG: hypothetical protein IJ168_05105 [Eubacterium sp.]|nr:hypothetical protein [Eubacterium sp.]